MIYFRERFPVPGVLMLGVGFALFSYGIHDQINNDTMRVLSLLTLLFVALLLRQRVTDEFKDRDHDNKNYPNRPVQRGVVTNITLVVIGGWALLMELLAVWLLGGVSGMVAYSPVFVFTLLMAREFFIALYLARHFTIYFLLHELVFVLLGIFVATVFGVTWSAVTVAWLVGFVSIMACVEIARKFELRHDAKGRIVADTYPAVWGESTARSTVEMLLLVTGIAMTYQEHMVWPAVIGASASVTINLFKLSHNKLRVVVAMVFVLLGVIGVFV